MLNKKRVQELLVVNNFSLVEEDNQLCCNLANHTFKGVTNIPIDRLLSEAVNELRGSLTDNAKEYLSSVDYAFNITVDNYRKNEIVADALTIAIESGLSIVELKTLKTKKH